MDFTTATLIGLGIIALVVLAFFAVFRHRGKFAIKTKLGEVSAEGENAPQGRNGLEENQTPSSQKVSGGTTEIGQVGTGANVFVAQPGSSIIVQTGERGLQSTASDQPAAPATPTEPSQVGLTETKQSFQPFVISEAPFDLECDTPPPTTTWVGRNEELQLMEHAGTKLIAITGIGGQGKSTLAAKFLASTKPKVQFQDWRDCKEESNTLHTQIVRIIERLTDGQRRASEISGESTASVIKLFLSLVSSVDGIFVFDNIDHYVDVVEARAVDSMQLLIEGALKSRGTARFVVTCRPRLAYEHPAFLQIQLHGLSVEESRQLFRNRGVSVDVRYVDEVHEATQGHPLWLNLIATQILTNKIEIRDFIARIKNGKDAGLPNVTLQEIWRTLKPKHQKLLRYLAEIVHPETERQLEEYVSSELNANQFTKCLRQLRSFDLVVVKSPANGRDTIELHPLVREFVRRQFSHSERSHYISAIVVFLDKHIVKLRPVLASEVSYEVLRNWTTKAELLINAGDYLKALAVLEEAKRPLLRSGYSEEFVRLAAELFTNLAWDQALIADSNAYDSVFKDFVESLTQLGRFEETESYIQKFESTVSGTTARHIAVCDMRAYMFWMEGKFDLAKKWGKRGVDFKASSQLDTKHDCSHHLALARRDSGEVDEAMSFFLYGVSMDDVMNPGQIFSSRGGSFYGNIGRCLFFKGDYQRAKLILTKSAVLLEKQKDELVLMNQGWAGLWLGELFEKLDDPKMAFICYKRAAAKWKLVSPPRADQAQECAQRLLATDKSLTQLQDWEIENTFVAWLKKSDTFAQVA